MTATGSGTISEKATGSVHDILYALLNIDPSSHDDMQKLFHEDQIIECCHHKENKPLFQNTYPITALYQGQQGGDIVNPLHMCCALGCSLSTIKLVYKQYPAALEYSSIRKGMKCLHYCVLYHRAPLDVIQYMI
jgi:hypothetical protein